MSYTLKVTNYFEIEVRGKTYSFWQGTDSDRLATESFDTEVDGDVHCMSGQLATAAAVTLWDDDDDKPADFDFMWFKASENCFLQVINSATQWSVPILAGIPFTLQPKTDALTAKSLAAANTTALSGTAPAVTEIDSIVLENNSGDTLYYEAFFVD